MSKKVCIIVMMLCLILVGCGNDSNKVSCEYESINECDLGQKLFENDRQFQIGNVMRAAGMSGYINDDIGVSAHKAPLSLVTSGCSF